MSTSAEVEFIQLTDDAGRLLLMPAATVNHLRSQGNSSIVVTISLDPARALREWLTLIEAARLHVDDVDGLNLDAARMRVRHACDTGQVTCDGTGTKRRIDPDSLDVWRLAQRERDLDRQDKKPERVHGVRLHPPASENRRA